MNSSGGLKACYLDICAEMKQDVNPYILNVLQHVDHSKVVLYDGFTLMLSGNSLRFPVQRLTDSDAAVLVCLLHRNSFITGLDLRFNHLSNCGAESIAKLLLKTNMLSDLNLMCNDIGSNGAEWIAKALQVNQSLKHLRINGNKLGNKGGMHFATMLQLNKTLESVDLGDCDLGIQSLIGLATVLNHNKSLKAINVGRPLVYTLQEEMTVHMANMLQVNQSLQELHLAKMGIKDFGVQQLCEQLVKNKTLRFLDLRCNQISCDGAKFLAELLRHNTPLKILDLAANRIGDDGLVYISEALRYLNDQLIALSVTSNCITGIGLVTFANVLKSNATLKNIYIWGNVLDESACSEFANLLKVGRLKPRQTDVSPYWIDGQVYLAEVSHGLQMFYYWVPQYGERDEAACHACKVLLMDPESSISQIDIETSSTERGQSSVSVSAGSLHLLTN
ncbi:leucine-rich repeat-containing protein 34 isoform X1 [Hypanus sabinus]|uniref:leucine-rich repeat-containing protein 34 isoform X1 n=2 Tax=Hypanus sabinus TaxID=79690 RepID=UPI0028C4D7D2|nr:leucine-rich repeat-containing protein 34 isoform X1 [Hypanus sabinus]XP_059846998.1 leucine-rich repeat-containing protein 34 isoform X1 [Hypanus sabinus]